MKKPLLFLLLPFACVGQGKYAARLDSFMRATVAVYRFNGNVLLAKSGNIIYKKAFGYRDYETKEPLNNNSVFELQSLTKQFTAVAILQLVEKGKLSLQDTLRHYFPELPYANVTIQYLLTHTSGLPDDLELMDQYWDHHKVADNKDVIQVLSRYNVPARFQPGKKWEYSNTAYELLGSIIEKVSRLSYWAYMHQYVFVPSHMLSSFATPSTVKSKNSVANYARGFIYSDSLKKYVLPKTVPELSFVSFLEDTYGAGNICSTTGDLLKWDRALKQHTLLHKQTQEAMFSPQSLMDTAAKRFYGYGVHLGVNEIGTYIQHGGDWPGYNTMLTRYVKDDITIIVLSNNGSNTATISGALAYIVTDRPVALPYMHKAISIDPAIMNRYVGTYKVPNVPNPSVIELFVRGGKLFYRSANLGLERELRAESATKFYTDAIDQQVAFKVDATGKVIKAYSIYGGMIKEIEKIK